MEYFGIQASFISFYLLFHHLVNGVRNDLQLDVHATIAEPFSGSEQPRMRSSRGTRLCKPLLPGTPGILEHKPRAQLNPARRAGRADDPKPRPAKGRPRSSKVRMVGDIK